MRVCLASFRDGQLPGSVSPKVANAEIKVNAAFVLLFFYRGIGYEVRDIEDGKSCFVCSIFEPSLNRRGRENDVNHYRFVLYPCHEDAVARFQLPHLLRYEYVMGMCALICVAVSACAAVLCVFSAGAV